MSEKNEDLEKLAEDVENTLQLLGERSSQHMADPEEEDLLVVESVQAEQAVPAEHVFAAIRENATVDSRNVGMIASPYVDPASGEPIETGTNSKDHPIYVAAHPRTGKMWVDAYNRQVVIDPEDGRTYIPYVIRRAAKNLDAPKFTNADVNEVAFKRIQGLDDGFVAFVEYIVAHPPRKRMRSPWARFNTFAQRLMLLVTQVMGFFFKRMVAVEKFIDRVVSRLRYGKPEPFLNVKPVDLTKYLTPKAAALEANKIPTTMYVTKDAVYEYHALAIRAPLDPKGNVKEAYKERWANLLNKLAEDGVWQQGVLAPTTATRLATTELRYDTMLSTMVFCRYGTSDKELNEKYAGGEAIFAEPGTIDFVSNWSKLPF